MPPQEQTTCDLHEEDVNEDSDVTNHVPLPVKKIKMEIVWKNIVIMAFIHAGGVYGLYLNVVKAMWWTRLFGITVTVFSGLGVIAGAHRLWSHKSYKAKLPLRLLLVFFQTVAFQDAILDWARNHRMHHKHSETDADPHNPTRGFFFSHMGWLLVRKHPQIKAKAHTIDMSDLMADPILRFQKKYYMYLMPLACFVMPTYVPTLWGETAWNAYFICAMCRLVFVLNFTWLVNSFAHGWGNKPYDKNMNPGDLKSVALVSFGEGFHNYHHTFPWDYKSAELGGYSLNYAKLFIDFMAKIGWAYDLKTVSTDVIQKRVMRTGDGSHPIWGWDDKDVTFEDKQNAIIVNADKDK